MTIVGEARCTIIIFLLSFQVALAGEVPCKVTLLMRPSMERVKKRAAAFKQKERRNVWIKRSLYGLGAAAVACYLCKDYLPKKFLSFGKQNTILVTQACEVQPPPPSLSADQGKKLLKKMVDYFDKRDSIWTRMSDMLKNGLAWSVVAGFIAWMHERPFGWLYEQCDSFWLLWQSKADLCMRHVQTAVDELHILQTFVESLSIPDLIETDIQFYHQQTIAAHSGVIRALEALLAAMSLQVCDDQEMHDWILNPANGVWQAFVSFTEHLEGVLCRGEASGNYISDKTVMMLKGLNVYLRRLIETYRAKAV